MTVAITYHNLILLPVLLIVAFLSWHDVIVVLLRLRLWLRLLLLLFRILLLNGFSLGSLVESLG
jgi:hypothetical protein